MDFGVGTPAGKPETEVKGGTGGPGAGWERHLLSADDVDDVDSGLSENWLPGNGDLNLRKAHFYTFFTLIVERRLGPSSISLVFPRRSRSNSHGQRRSLCRTAHEWGHDAIDGWLPCLGLLPLLCA